MWKKISAARIHLSNLIYSMTCCMLLNKINMGECWATDVKELTRVHENLGARKIHFSLANVNNSASFKKKNGLKITVSAHSKAKKKKL